MRGEGAGGSGKKKNGTRYVLIILGKVGSGCSECTAVFCMCSALSALGYLS